MLTFGPMIDSEIARQLLRHYQVPFTEERHLFGWSSILSLIRAGTPRNPVIMGQGLSLAGSRAVANYFDPLAPDDLKLLPLDPTLRARLRVAGYVLASAPRSIAIGGSVQGATFITGDGNHHAGT